MNLYDIWIDGEGNCHLISEMETGHIYYCVHEIHKAANLWRFHTFREMSKDDMRKVSKPLSKSWFVVNGQAYLHSFREELIERCENTEQIDATIEYVVDAQSSI